MDSHTLILTLTALLYFLATIFFLSAFWKRQQSPYARYTALLALAAHSTVFLLRGIEAGRLPGLGLYEVTLGYTWLASLTFSLLLYFYPSQFPAGIFAMPVLMIGIIMSVFVKDAPPYTAAHFYSPWFYAHVLTAYMAFGFILVATALALTFLLSKKSEHKNGFLPPFSLIDMLSWRILGIGFLFLGLMIVTGGIWANQSWGRYWAWDPIETWSLISWLLYGILLHLRRLHGWHGKKAAIFQLGAFSVLVFTLFFISLFFQTIHRAYF